MKTKLPGGGQRTLEILAALLVAAGVIGGFALLIGLRMGWVK